ncbi:58_t:CDS:2, partial [Cetraspora pellucida]
QFTFTSNEGIHFTKIHQKNDQGGIDGNSNALIILVLPDMNDYQGPKQK